MCMFQSHRVTSSQLDGFLADMFGNVGLGTGLDHFFADLLLPICRGLPGDCLAVYPVSTLLVSNQREVPESEKSRAHFTRPP